jgi:chorismate mutase
MSSVRGFRGATQLTGDNASEMRAGVTELLEAIFLENSIKNDDLISILFTATTDLKCEFPAVAARIMGLSDVPLICSQEIGIENSLPMTIRVLIHAQSDLPRSAIVHKYMRGAQILRPDLEI